MGVNVGAALGFNGVPGKEPAEKGKGRRSN
jgi:hypothetical protein